MFNKLFALFVILFALTCSTAFAFDGNDSKDKERAADEKAIRDHIDKIFQAYMKKDRETVKATHSTNWRGFISGSRSIVRGIDEYMRDANGAFAQNYKPFVGYKMLEYDVIFYGDTAFVSYIAELSWESDGQPSTSKLRVVDLYAKENGEWTQVASNTGPHPETITKSYSDSRTITSQFREFLLKAREEVWQAYFANDTAKLQKLIPKETIAINPGEESFENQTSIFASAKGFAESGAKLVKLEFPKTEIQSFGATVIMYSNYIYEIEAKGQKQTYSGRATEIFVIRNNVLENVGWHIDKGK